MSYDSPNPATNITELNEALPAAGDSRTEGDDHIRSIKNAIKGSFPNFTGSSVTSTEAELNYLDGSVAGTGVASKAVVLDGSNAVSTGGAITCTTFTVTGDVTLGTGGGNNITFNGDVVGHVTPNDDGLYDLGWTTLQWRNLYVNGTAYIDNLQLTSGATVSVIQDEDNMASDSATSLCTQQSIKAYSDNKLKLKSGAGSLAAGTMQVFVSAAIAYSSAGLAFTAQSHGLSGTPQDLNIYAICTNAGGDAGYAQNDYVAIPWSSVSSSFGVSVWATSSQVDGKVGTGGVRVLNKSTGSVTTLSTGSWNFYIVAKYFV